MSNFVMTVTLGSELIRCETDGQMVSLNDLVAAGNKYRVSKGLPIRNLFDMRSTQSYIDFKTALSKRLDTPEIELEKPTKGRGDSIMGHYAIGIYIAEQLSPEFHVDVIAEFVNGRILEFREFGGIEYKQLSSELDKKMQVWEGRDAHIGHYIALANIMKSKILFDNQTWDNATDSQTRIRFNTEEAISNMLRLDLIRDWEHLKQVTKDI